jgi:hypothetical protein
MIRMNPSESLLNETSAPMKNLVAIAFLVGVYTGVVCVEYRLAMWLGIEGLALVGGALVCLGAALFRAPQQGSDREAVYVRRNVTSVTRIASHRVWRLIRVRL